MTFETPPESLQQDGITLRGWEPEDAAWYVANRDEEVFRWTTEPRDLTAEALAVVIRANDATPQFLAYAITDTASGIVLGSIAMKPDGEAMYWLAPQGRGRGAASTALSLIAAWGLSLARLDRVWLKTLPGNEASQAVARRCGFHQCGDDADHVEFERLA